MQKARKLKPAGREFWVMEFRHPLVKDKHDKSRKIRRGLGTSNEIEAQELIDQMNIILSDESYWKPSSRQLAEDKFSPEIVSAFYDEIKYVISDDEETREKVIPLKNFENNYTRVLLLGSTGAGKTTLLRQLMGTDPKTERFPATSTARTTVFDTEIILAEGEFKSVVTFFSESETRQMVQESVQNAMQEYFTRNDDNHTLRVFLEDKDQRFRLSYLIGKIKEDKSLNQFENFEEFEQSDDEELNLLGTSISDLEQKQFEGKINDFLQGIKSITDKIVQKDRQEYKSTDISTEELRNLLEEIIITDISNYDGDDLATLVDEIMDEIRLRFIGISNDGLVTEKFGWPIYWAYNSNNRTEFLKAIRFFSSNSATQFGKLLTPLVSGMRIQGPFKPDSLNNIPKLVIYDGEGLGHIPDTTSNLPFKTIKKFDNSDAILLVDNSQSPMLASAYAVIKSVAISGHSQKLVLCFTHFDSVKGDNLPKIEDKKNHIFGSVDGLLAKLETELDYEVKKYFLKQLPKSAFYLGYIDEKLEADNNKHKFTIHQLKELTNYIDKIRPESSSLSPNYDTSTLVLRIRKAAIEFHERWEGHLFGNNKWSKQHFSKVKALARRLGANNGTEYRELTPISDFWTYFNSHISNFLASPVSWNQANPKDEDIQLSINNLRQKVTTKIQNYALQSIKNDQIGKWQAAFSLGGGGSAIKRANAIESIYSETAPILNDELTVESKRFLAAIMQIIRETIKENGGSVVSV